MRTFFFGPMTRRRLLVWIFLFIAYSVGYVLIYVGHPQLQDTWRGLTTFFFGVPAAFMAYGVQQRTILVRRLDQWRDKHSQLGIDIVQALGSFPKYVKEHGLADIDKSLEKAALFKQAISFRKSIDEIKGIMGGVGTKQLESLRARVDEFSLPYLGEVEGNANIEYLNAIGALQEDVENIHAAIDPLYN